MLGGLDGYGQIIPSFLVIQMKRYFLLLTKILDANMDLSVQVHPDDAYAKVQ